MGVEEVDMAVPVGGTGPSDGSEAAAGALSEAAVAALQTALHRRSRPAFSRRQRSRRAAEYDAAVKLVVKRLAADVSGAIQERRLAERTRVEVYASMMALVRVLEADRAGLAERLRRRGTLFAAMVAMAGLAIPAVLLTAGWLSVS